MNYVVVIFNKFGMDNHVPVRGENLDAFILRAIWTPNFDHFTVFEAHDE